MKKAISLMLVIVLLFSMMNFGVFGLVTHAVCTQHEYTNACDSDCNKCGDKREINQHDYLDCFIGYEEEENFFGKWTITPDQTGLFLIESNDLSKNFTNHCVFITDKNGCEVKFNQKLGGWPLVANQDYNVYLKCIYEDVDVSKIDYELVFITDAIFPDTLVGEWYSDAIVYSVGAGYIKGHDNGNFAPTDAIQRQDFLVILARTAGAELVEYELPNDKFPDVVRGSYYESAIAWGLKNGVVTGYENGDFGVGDNITREQIVTFLYRYIKNIISLDAEMDLTTEARIANTYTDYNRVSKYAKEAIVWAIENNVISGKNPTTIAPLDAALRCETAKIIYNNHINETFPCVKPCIHSYSEATCDMVATCYLCGKTRGEVLQHEYCEATCTAPAFCVNCGDSVGNAKGHFYVAGECIRYNDGVLCADYEEDYCPKLYFTGDMSKITDPNQRDKKIECEISFEYRSREQIKTGAAKIKIQGSSSTQYAKKNYTINFYNDDNYSSKQKIDVGWGAQSKYCLKANWIDKTHSRNIVSANLAGKVQAKYGLFTQAPHNGTVDGFPVEIYINDDFHGLYTMNIPKDEWMFGMDKDNPNHIVICGENWNDPVLFKSVPTDLKDWTVEAGPEDDATLQKVQRIVEFVKDSSDEDFKKNFSEYFDLDSALNYYIMMGYFWASDNTGKNMLLATYDGKVWYPTMYDLDSTWGTNWRGDGLNNYSGTGVINGSNSVLWQKFEKNFKEEIAARYFELRNTVLIPNNVMAEFTSFHDSIPQEVLDREKAKWNTEEHPIPGYDLSQIQDYLDTVIPRLDKRYASWL